MTDVVRCPGSEVRCGATVSATLYGFHEGHCPYCGTLLADREAKAVTR